MTAAEYAWKPGARLQSGARVPAQVVGDHLEFLREGAGGELTPAMVLEDAAGHNSPLHPLFEWCDSEAAHRYRLHQARQLIRAIVVRYRETRDSAPKTVHAFVNLRNDDKQHFYTTTVVAMSDEQLRAKAVRQAWAELQAFRKRYGNLIEFGQLFASLDDLERSLPPVVGPRP